MRPLTFRGVSRLADNARALVLSFDRKPTDDELRDLHETLKAAPRALEIADVAMFELLQSECVPHDDAHTVLGMLNDSYSEVPKLAEASQGIRDAYEWLAPRGFVELASDPSGEYITVCRRPGEDE